MILSQVGNCITETSQGPRQGLVRDFITNKPVRTSGGDMYLDFSRPPPLLTRKDNGRRSRSRGSEKQQGHAHLMKDG